MCYRVTCCSWKNKERSAGIFGSLCVFMYHMRRLPFHDDAQCTMVQRKKTLRMQVLEKPKSSFCLDGCDMKWLICSREILQKNNIKPFVSADTIRDLLIQNRGKFRNIITVPLNCGKRFVLKPLETIYHRFSNPANDRYAWVAAEDVKVIILQEFYKIEQ